MAKKQFLRNKSTNSGFEYKWSPTVELPKDIDIRRTKRKKDKNLKNFCNATPLSQGIDNKVKYVYKFISYDKHVAYVECDYVK